MARERKAVIGGSQTARYKLTKDTRPDINFEKELWDAAVRLRGNIVPADYKHGAGRRSL